MGKILADQFTQEIHSIFSELSAKTDLSPNNNTNALFSSLVDLVLYSEHGIYEEVLGKLEQEGTLQSLIDLCCRGEIELERYWAKKVVSDGRGIKDFPYYRNYLQLTDYELQQLRGHVDLGGKKLFFVGSGALPLTPIMFKEQQPSLEVRCIDRDAESVKYAKSLLSKLGINDLLIDNHDIDNLDYVTQSQLSDIDIIFIAALVGSSNGQKNQILNGIHPYLTDGTLIAIRSVPDDMRRLLYPKFELGDKLKTKYKRLGEYYLPREAGVINSIVVLSSG